MDMEGSGVGGEIRVILERISFLDVMRMLLER